MHNTVCHAYTGILSVTFLYCHANTGNIATQEILQHRKYCNAGNIATQECRIISTQEIQTVCCKRNKIITLCQINQLFLVLNASLLSRMVPIHCSVCYTYRLCRRNAQLRTYVCPRDHKLITAWLHKITSTRSWPTAVVASADTVCRRTQCQWKLYNHSGSYLNLIGSHI